MSRECISVIILSVAVLLTIIHSAMAYKKNREDIYYLNGEILDLKFNLTKLNNKSKTSKIRPIDILEKLKSKIILYESDCRLSGYEHPNCKKCTDNVFNTIYKYIDEIEKEIE